MDAARTRRLSERIAKIVAELLERRIKDPRLGFVTVTEVRLTQDWREAKVFYTVFGTPEELQDTAIAPAQRDRRHPLRGRPDHRPAARSVDRVHRRRAARQRAPDRRPGRRGPPGG